MRHFFSLFFLFHSILATVEASTRWFADILHQDSCIGQPTTSDFWHRGGGCSNSRQQEQHEQQPIQFFIFVGGLCPFAGRTWIALLELGLPFEMTYIDFQRQQEKSNSYLKVNPRGRVPAIYNPNDGYTVYESSICNEYLCDLASSSLPSDASTACSLMPSEAGGRAMVRLLNDKFEKDIFPKVRAYLMNDKDDNEKTLKKECENALADLEQTLGKGPYFMGNTFTVADIHVVPFVMRWIAQLRDAKGFDMTKKYKRLKRWYDRCQTRPSVQAATIPDDKIIEIHYTKLKLLQKTARQS